MKKIISILTILTISMTNLVYADIGNEKNVKVENNKDVEEVFNKKERISSIIPEGAVIEEEPNNSAVTADEFVLGDSVIGEFGVYPDLDYFKFTVDEQGEFFLLANTSNSVFDSFLSIGLIGSDGKTVLSASSLITSSGNTYQVIQEDLVPGVYYLVVYQGYTQESVSEIYSTVYSFITDFTPTKADISVESVLLSKPALTLDKGQSETIVATINPSNASNKDINWTSSNTQVATVDDNGKVTGISEGIATITASAEKGTKIAVSSVTVKSSEVNDDEYRVLPSKSDVPVDKVWTVKFNLPIDKNTIKEKNIYVTDSNGTIITMLYIQGEDNKVYLSPTKDYVRGGKYTLWIKDLSGQKGQKLKKFVKMDFVIKQ